MQLSEPLHASQPVTAKGLALTQWSYEPGRAGLLKTDRSQ